MKFIFIKEMVHHLMARYIMVHHLMVRADACERRSPRGVVHHFRVDLLAREPPRAEGDLRRQRALCFPAFWEVWSLS